MLSRRGTIPGTIRLKRLPPIDFIGQFASKLVASDTLINNSGGLGNDAVEAFGDDRHGSQEPKQQEYARALRTR
jgi:hypothetical protein